MNTASTAANNAYQSLTDEQMKSLDIMILLDQSGSMGQGSTRRKGKTKWEELQEDCLALSTIAAKYDSDGLTVGFFGQDRISVVDGVTASHVGKIFQEHQPRGGTPLHLAIQAAIDKRTASGDKPLLAIIYTDGVPDDQMEVKNLIESAGKQWPRPGISFVFLQVGDDAGASTYLQQLNNLKTDVVAVIPAAQSENLGLEQIAWAGWNS